MVAIILLHSDTVCFHYVMQVVLVLWEQSYDESHYTYHPHENLPGILMILLRIALAVLFGYNLRQTMEKERSTLKKTFYRSFSIVRFELILCLYSETSNNCPIHVHVCSHAFLTSEKRTTSLYKGQTILGPKVSFVQSYMFHCIYTHGLCNGTCTSYSIYISYVGMLLMVSGVSYSNDSCNDNC